MALDNKLGITDHVTLAHEEERISKWAALSLYRDGSLGSLEPGSFAALAAIRSRLFGELYPFVSAGVISHTGVSPKKGSTLSRTMASLVSQVLSRTRGFRSCA